MYIFFINFRIVSRFGSTVLLRFLVGNDVDGTDTNADRNDRRERNDEQRYTSGCSFRRTTKTKSENY